MSSNVRVVDHGWNRFLRRMLGAGSTHVDVGILPEDASTPHGSGNVTLGELSIIMEHGSISRGIPARPAITRTFRENKKRYYEKLRQKLKKFILLDEDQTRILSELGQEALADIRVAIGRGIRPLNAESTLAQKTGSVPLIDTGEYVHAMRSEVRNER